MGLTTKTLSFSQEYIRPGHLVILYDGQNRLIGSGVVLIVEPLELRLALYMSEGNTTQRSGLDSSHYELLDQVTPYDLHINLVESKEIQLFMINPGTYIIGEEDASVLS